MRELLNARFIIGIDLGTTNSAVSYVDREGDKTQICSFEAEQVIANGEVQKRDSLPSFYYIAPEHEYKALALPWAKEQNYSVGYHARNFGCSTPMRFVSSAKSWLSHSGVDRTANILPWGSDLTDDKLSPLAVSQAYLQHVRMAWNQQFSQMTDQDGTACILEEQQVVLTVPASFDETARELTVEAAQKAGFKHITLLEEPLAAFYSFLSNNEKWQDVLKVGDKVLIVDIGGGTTDFSLIDVHENNTLKRSAVGNHLLLGGDNIDMALAHTIEQEWKCKLDHKEWSVLVQQCRQAKEELLNNSDKENFSISLISRGSSIIASSRNANLKREQILGLIENGFYPEIDAKADAPQKKSGLRDMGLPYEKDPAVTKHLLQFLRNANFDADDKLAPVIPDKILFNGGSMIPQSLRDRILNQIKSWNTDADKTVEELSSQSLDLAVSVGASYYGLVRLGEGIQVKGGIARAFYLGVEKEGQTKLICIAPRETDEGQDLKLDMCFKLTTNKPVKFPVYSSATRLHDKLGDEIAIDDTVLELPPLCTSLKFGKKEQEIDVTIDCLLNEIGTLEVYLDSTQTDHRWQLKFDMRALHGENEEASVDVLDQSKNITFTQAQINEAKEIINTAFKTPAKLQSINKDLEKCLEYPKEQWPLVAIRELFDHLLEFKDLRKKSALAEARWLNLTGFLARPGFGHGTDAWRIKQVWTLWFDGIQSKSDAQVNAEWWVMWRRLSGGLKKGQQTQLFHAVSKAIFPKGKYKTVTKNGQQEKREMWRCIASLENLAVKEKSTIAEVLVNRSSLEDYEFWTLSRLGARNLFYGSAETVIPAKEAAKWLRYLLDCKKSDSKMALHALGQIASHCDDKLLDIDDKLKSEVQAHLEAKGASEAQIKRLTEKVQQSADENRQILGDALPIGLKI